MDTIKTLILEDDVSIQDLYKKALPENVFEIKCVTNGKEGLSVYTSWKPDIVLLDVYMPVMTGFLVLKEIRTHIGDHKTTIIMQTTLSRKDDVMQCVKLGIQGYIVKPFEYKTIARTILKYYESAYPERAKAAQAVLAKSGSKGKKS